MTDKTPLSQITVDAREAEGRSAFESGKGLDANPYSILNSRWDWSRGWFEAREVSFAQWKGRIVNE